MVSAEYVLAFPNIYLLLIIRHQLLDFYFEGICIRWRLASKGACAVERAAQTSSKQLKNPKSEYNNNIFHHHTYIANVYASVCRLNVQLKQFYFFKQATGSPVRRLLT